MHSTQVPHTHHPHAHATQDTHAPTLFTMPLPYPHPRCHLLPLFLSFTAHPTLYANLTDPSILWRIFFLFKRSVLPVCCSRTVSLNLSPNFIPPSSLSPCGETSTFVGSSCQRSGSLSSSSEEPVSSTPLSHSTSPGTQPPVCAKSLQPCLTPCDPVDGSPPGSPVHGILQARTPEWGRRALQAQQRDIFR